ncbi:MAG TPA: hypothetical protein DCE56_20600 [Cyanobacteria bacterium UBA8553]|nr:hypothetical protein [Cyanobacteria bacterium UBA8553]
MSGSSLRRDENFSSPRLPTPDSRLPIFKLEFQVYQLIDGSYQVKQFRDSERIESPTFSELNLTASQIFGAGE